MKTGLIGAMREEIQLLEHDIENLKVHEYGVRKFYEGTIGGKEVVMVLSGWGKVAAASTATTLINLFQVDQLVFIGLAGSLMENLRIGDIVVADKLIQHDVDLTRLDGLGTINPPFYKKFKFPVRKGAQKRALEAVKQFTYNLHGGQYPEINAKYQPTIHIGAIGTGDQFVASRKGKDKIVDKHPELFCTEMEGAAIAQVAADYRVPCTVIRIISDNADDDAHASFERFLFEDISKISVEIARLMFV
ncbi:5'-methylthioadenosine/adenosylhomocysteine nucleosidase [Mangrovibacterium marinum]|uniref:adenosylhomocysteine nucleosidase n=1 Tax=Mangrovibacterium marinum TaxID=1639118 RepID=A0A2T5C2S3_9BACT|nr:5'-methylthioadenosine/adenosylhomocysteine nucleosidase [Mangrovibacterium marinum]PTN09015.1 adenosylhomocysteine nucleosidase [Mangrovibacterium marinum]